MHACLLPWPLSCCAGRECTTNCQGCHSVCLATIQHCLQQGGKHAEASHLRALQGCAQICAASADFMIRGSAFHGRTCGACAEVCRRCAESCRHIAAKA